MTYDRKYGKPEGLAERLDEWVARLSTDKMLPWAGMGLLDDLRCASAELRDPTVSKPLVVGNWQKPVTYTPPPPSHATKMEFDL